MLQQLRPEEAEGQYASEWDNFKLATENFENLSEAAIAKEMTTFKQIWVCAGDVPWLPWLFDDLCGVPTTLSSKTFLTATGPT